MRKPLHCFALPVALVLAIPAFRAAAQTSPIELDLKLDPLAAQQAKVGTTYARVALTTQKPAEIVKEPMYRATPKYAVLHLGNGPHATYVLSMDEPADGDVKIYIDKNHNGDLTAPEDAATMTKHTVRNSERFFYTLAPVTLHASWGTSENETGAGDYGIGFLHNPNQAFLLVRSMAGRVATITLGGKTHNALLVENNADAIFSKPVALDEKGKPVHKLTTNPVYLLVDLNDSGDFRSLKDMTKRFDIRGPFEMAGARYEATVTPDGSHLTLTPTTKAVADFSPPPPPPLLEAGTVAPDFIADAWGGGSVKLSDLRGKVVVLDFWATWCPPCQRSMPHLEKVHRAAKDQGVVVLAVCVSDERSAYEEWMPKHKDDFTYRFAYDPAGRDFSKNISATLYHVHGIPTTYIIDREGKVVASVVGFSGDNDHRIEEALKKVGITADTEKSAANH